MVNDRAPANHQSKTSRLRLPALLRRTPRASEADSIRSLETTSSTQLLSSSYTPPSSTRVQSHGRPSTEVSTPIQREKAGLWEWSVDSNEPDAIYMVAVHGLQGDWEKTWEQEGRIWLRDFLGKRIEKLQVLSFGYNTMVTSSEWTQDIEQFSSQLLQSLKNIIDTEQKRGRPIIFLGHSLGGLIIKKALITAHNKRAAYSGILEQTAGLIFMGTPHRGSDAAKWASMLKESIGIFGLGPTTNLLSDLKQQSRTLMQINSDFVERAHNIQQILSFYETHKMRGLNALVVNEESATLHLPNETSIGLNADHRSMCRFSSEESQEFDAVCRPIVDMVGVIRAKPTEKFNEKRDQILEALRTRSSINLGGPLNEPIQPAEGTCQWISSNPDYKEWRDNPGSSLFWITGSPGSGKSFLSDFIAKDLQKDLTSFTCKFSFTGGKYSTFDLLRYMISQAVSRNKKLCQQVIDVWGTDDWLVSCDSLWSLWVKICEEIRSGQVCWVIDALDECTDQEGRKDFLKKTIQLLQRSNRARDNRMHFRLLLTSRPEVWRELSTSAAHRPQELSGLSRMILENESSIEKDIQIFIQHELGMMVNEGLVQRRVALKLENKLFEGADRTFIWPQLILQAIRNDPEAYSENKLEAALQVIPQTLEGIYEKLLLQLAENTVSPGAPTRLPPKTKKLFQFVLAAQGPLTVSELNILFSLESDPGTIIAAEREADDISPVVERVYGSFLRPVTDANGVQQVRLFHDTARSHLLVPSSKSNYAMGLSDCHLALAEGCISYLWLHDFAAVFQQFTLESRGFTPQKRQFLRYASLNWAYHVRESEDLMNDELLERVLALYSTRSRRFANWTAAYWNFSSGHVVGRAPTPLQMCAYNGHARVLRRLLQNIGTIDIQAQIDQHDAAGNTALHYAAENGRAASIAILMEFKADPTIRNTVGLAALHKAVNSNEEAAVLALLNGGVNVDTRTTGEKPNRTVLHIAAENGLQKMVEKLVEHGANIDILDSRSRTAAKIAFDKGHGEIARFLDTHQLDSGITDLDRAIIDGNEERVRELVGAGASLSSKDNRGLTPLHRAARGENASILKFLLGDTNNTEAIDDDGRTPLHVAARYGQYASMDVLLSRNADLNVKSTDGLTPIHEGVFSGKLSIIDRLLDAGGNQHESDRERRTPLFSASSLGYHEIVKILLRNSGQHKLELIEDDNGRLPIHIAAENGHIAAVIALLNENDDTIAKEDRKGCSPLSLAACGISQNHAETVKYLIQRGANICHRQRDGSTPILQAAVSGNEQSVKYLLGEGCDIPGCQKVNPDERNSRRSTPFSLAVAKGHESVALLLLKHGARDVSRHENPGRRVPLSWAAGHGMLEVVKLLLAIPDVLIDPIDANSRTPLSWAAEKGHTDVVKLLLDSPRDTASAAIIDSVDTDNRTPLSWAAGAGHELTVKILLNYGADPTLRSKRFGSPITWAAVEGHTKVIVTLLDSNLVEEKDMIDHTGGSLMHLAAKNGKAETVKLLLDHPNPRMNEPNRLNKKGQSPMLLAAKYGHDDIVKLLLEHGARVDTKMPYTGDTALTLAIQSGDWVIVDKLIKYDKNVLQTKTAYGYTPLFLAVHDGRYEIAKLLLDNGCDPDMQPTRMLYTLLHAAAETGHFLVLKLVLKHVGHRFKSQDAEGRTPLMIAVAHGREQAVTTLISYAQNLKMTVKDILRPDHRQRSVLTAAVKSKKLGIVRAILDIASKEPDMLSSKDVDGWTPLSRAAAIGSTDSLRLLCHPGNVNEKDQIWHKQPLLWAAQHGDEEAVRLFLNDPSLSQKLDRYAVSEHGCTSLWCAVRYRQLNVVKLLLQDETPQPYLRKAWLNATDRFSDNMLSPLQMAVCSDSPEIVKLLLEEKDIEVNAQDHHGVSVFLSAVQTGNKTLVKTLAEITAIDVDLRDHENHSPLMRACKKGYLSIVKYLLSCKKMSIPIDATDNEGMSALAHACAAADPAIVQLLLDCGASITQKIPPSNRNLLMLAAHGGSVQIVAMLSDREELDINAADDGGLTALAIAAMANKSNVVRLLLNKKADPNTRSRRSQRTPLMEAAYMGCAAAIRELLRSPDIDFTCTNNAGRTATWFLMRQAVGNAYQDPSPSDYGSTAELFLEFEQEKLCVNEVDIEGATPLILLARGGDHLSSRRLLNLGADINYQSWETGQSVFHEAAKSYYPQMLSELLEAGKRDTSFDCRDLDHATPLSYAAGNPKDILYLRINWNMDFLDTGNTWASTFENSQNQVSKRYQMVQMLIEYGADVNSATRKEGRTPIMFAARLGWESIVTLLLDSGATVNTRDANYSTALSLAVESGHYATVKRLLQAGASHDIKDRTGASVVILAAKYGNLPILRLFIDSYQLAIDHRDRDGRTALSYAAEQNHVNIVRYLLEQQCQAPLVDALDRQDQSALIWACKGGDCTIIKLLIQNGANASRKDRNGRMALSHASENGRVDACRLLLEEESEDMLFETLNWTDDAGRTALSWAAEENKIGVIRALLMRGADPLLCDKRNQTPRMFALARGHTKVARMIEPETTSPQPASANN